MKLSKKRATAALVAGAFVLAPALSSGADGAAGTGAARASSVDAAKRGDATLRMSTLIGMDVRNRAGDKLGEVKDAIVNTTTGEVQYIVLSSGGVLGIGDRLFAMPLSQARPDDKGRLVVDVDKKRLESAPSFESGRWPDWNDKSYRERIDRQYASTAADANARYRRASDVVKAKVRDVRGGDIGHVKDMVVDIPASRIDYVIVEFDRAWTPDDKPVALPMSAFADGTTARRTADAEASAPPRNPPPALALTNPSGEPTQGTASAVEPPEGVRARPPALDPAPDAAPRPIERRPLPTTTSYADDENLVYKGTREELLRAPAFDESRLPR